MMPALPILAGRPEPDVLRTAHGVPGAIERRPEPPFGALWHGNAGEQMAVHNW